MERSIRIGKDFNVRWSINKVVDGERQPYELAGKELVLQYRTPYGLKEATEWKVVGNTIVWTFRGKEQKALGSYELILTENGGKDGMVTVDTCRAFKLVAHSCEETEGSGSDIVIEDLVLESEVAFAALRGPQGEQGPAGPSYDDTEIKGKLAELSAENEVLKEAQQFTDVAVKDLQDMKIDRENDDYYPKMAVGLADNLAGVDVVDSEINFRRSGGGAISDGVARIESIKGNSVVWNQLLDPTRKGNGRLKAYKENGKWVAEVTELGNNSDGASLTIPVIKGQTSVQGHKYLATLDITNDYSLEPAVKIGNAYKTGTFHIIESSDSSLMYLYPFGAGSSQKFAQGSKAVLNVALFCDLTQMFGAGNEPTTIEEFYARIPMGVDLNAYNEGEVIHMDVQSIESQGVNAWDEEWEIGALDTITGAPAANDTRIRSKNYFEVLPNATYSVTPPASMKSNNIKVYYYNVDYSFIGTSAWIGANKQDFTTPQDSAFAKFVLAEITTYTNDFCINLSDTSINGKYFPHIKRVEDLAVIRKYFPQGMKSAGSAHDEIRYNKASGKWEKVVRIGEMDMGSLAWGKSSSGTYTVYSQSLAALIKKSTLNLFTKNLIYGAVNGENTGFIKSDGGGTIYASLAPYTDAASFKAAMSGVMLYYELAEPIVTELDEADQFRDLDYAVWNAGTEKAIAEGKSAPLAADITYGFNAIGKIKELESLVAALRAKVGI